MQHSRYANTFSYADILPSLFFIPRREDHPQTIFFFVILQVKVTIRTEMKRNTKYSTENFINFRN